MGDHYVAEDEQVTTGVDALIELLKQHEKLSLVDAAKQLGISEETLKLWVDFLVEEKVIGLEYKFTKPYLYLNRQEEEIKGKVSGEEEINIDTFKKDFENRANESNIKGQQVQFLWKDHVLNQLDLEKPFFFREARKRELDNIESLWDNYRKDLVKEKG